MKVLFVNCVFNVGSTGRIVYDLSCYLAEHGHTPVVCYGRGKVNEEPNIYKVSSEQESKYNKVLSRLFGLQLGRSSLATSRLIRIIMSEHPDVVHLHCLNTHFVNVYRLLGFLKQHKIKTVLTLHAEFMYTAGCGCSVDCDKWQTECSHCPRIEVSGRFSRFFRDDAKLSFHKMCDSLRGFKEIKIVGCSDWIVNRASRSPIMNSFPIRTIHNGIAVEYFRRVNSAELRKKLGISTNKKVVLHITPSFKNLVKGGKYLLECARKLPDYYFIIVGYDGQQEETLPSNILPIAFTTGKDEMAQYYSLADCFALTSIRDNYPTVCLEATCCGLPVVGFDVGGVKETIPEGMGECVPPFDVEKMVRSIRKWSRMTVSEDTIIEARKKHSKGSMCEKYMSVYQELL